MLQSQVNYWTLQENKRHNVAQEEIGRGTLGETVRHNIVTEGQTNVSLGESHRHNLAQELYWTNSLAETTRHNVAQENLGYDTLYETRRHNIQSEDIGREGNAIGWYNANTNRMNAETSRQSMWNQYTLGKEQLSVDRAYKSAMASASQLQAEARMTSAEAAKNQANLAFTLGWSNYAVSQRVSESQIALNESNIMRNNQQVYQGWASLGEKFLGDVADVYMASQGGVGGASSEAGYFKFVPGKNYW